MDWHRSCLFGFRVKDSRRAGLVYRYAIIDSYCYLVQQQTDMCYSRLCSRHLPPQPLPRLHLPQIRPFSRCRHRHGGWRSRRPVLPSHKERPRVQAFCSQTTRVQVLAFGDTGCGLELPVQLERDLQSASVLASIGDLLVDLGVFDDEEADSEYDQVQVS